MDNKVIGIEGLVGSGKTSICKELLNYIPNSVVLHGGNLYRAIVYAILKSGNNIEELKSKMKDIDIKTMMDAYDIKIEVENKETVVYIHGQKIDENELQSEESSMAVSVVSNVANNKAFFIFARDVIDRLKINNNVIVSGRALMEIYPKLDYHFLITASLDERVHRKAIQYGNNVDLEQLKSHIQKRDELQEKSGFYKQYPNTKIIDVTQCKSAEESTLKVLANIR